MYRITRQELTRVVYHSIGQSYEAWIHLIDAGVYLAPFAMGRESEVAWHLIFPRLLPPLLTDANSLQVRP